MPKKDPGVCVNRPGAWPDWLESNVNESTCTTGGCDSPILARGWCRLHYGRWRRYGDPTATPTRNAASSTCSVEDCEGPHPKIRMGLCGKHYQRRETHGSTDLPPRVYRMCEGPECSRRAGTSGLCRSHYKQQHLGKSLTPLLVASKNLGRPDYCMFPGCDRPHKARGLCKSHRDHVAKEQELHPIKVYNPGAICSEPECDRPAVARGLCAKDIVYTYEVTKRYGLTLDQYDEMLQSQGGVCKICLGVNPSGYRLSIDHDHGCCPGQKSCGRCVRGLLCAKCNFILGHANDDINRLHAAADYLASRKM